MKALFDELMNNRILAATVLSWFTAQLLKVILVCVINRKLDFGRMIGSGGMPSSHSAFVVSLAVSIGLECGFDSALFAIAACVALVVMYDAAGVRRSAGQQARILNKLVDSWGRGNFENTEKRLKELLGHTPIEVFAGAILGLVIALIMHS